jgi:hypothetical protein
MRKGATVKSAYEDILASEILVGDIVRQSVKEWPVEVEFIDIGRSCVIVNGSRTYQSSEKVSRKLPPERNPDVLELALELMIAGGGDRKPYDAERQIIAQFIKQAIRELEREAGNASKRTHSPSG